MHLTWRLHDETYELGGKLYLETTDSTIPGIGQIGLWPKADAVTSFDKLTVTPPAK